MILKLTYNPNTKRIGLPSFGSRIRHFLFYYVHPDNREWSSVDACWYVTPEALKSVLPKLQKLFTGIDFSAIPNNLGINFSNQYVGAEENTPPISSNTDARLYESFKQLHLLSSAPWALVRSAYKILSKQHHPDFGGSHEQMVKINTAYDYLSQHYKTTGAAQTST